MKKILLTMAIPSCGGSSTSPAIPSWLRKAALAQTIQRAGGVFVGLSEDEVLVFFNDRDPRYRSTMCLPTESATLRRVYLKIRSKRREYQPAVGNFTKEV